MSITVKVYNPFMQRKPSPGWLRSRGVPAVLIPGIIFAASLGWLGWKQLANYRSNSGIFPKSATVISVADGDTLEIRPSCPSNLSSPSVPSCPSSLPLRLIGVDSPGRGQDNFENSKQALEKLVMNKKVWLEYDRYQDDKFGRILAWLWINCETEPEFTPADYMKLSGNQSKPELVENPQGCRQGKLIQEELVESGGAKPIIYSGRGKLKYQSRVKGR